MINDILLEGESMNIFIRLAIIIGTLLMIMKVSDILFTRLGKSKKHIHVKFMQGLVKAFILLFGIVLICMQFEVTKQLSNTLIQNTALLVAVLGFAAQQTLNDILSGFMISWYHPFDIGERIHLTSKNITGIVEDITLRHTVIQCFDNNRIIIPNSIINKEILKNSNYDDSVIGNFLEIGISGESNIYQAMDIIHQIITNHPYVITSDTYTPGTLIKNINKDGYLLKAAVWTKNVDENFQACSDIRISIHETFLQENIKLI